METMVEYLGYIDFAFDEWKPRAALESLRETFGGDKLPPPPVDAPPALIREWFDALDRLATVAIDDKDDRAIERARAWASK